MVNPDYNNFQIFFGPIIKDLYNKIVKFKILRFLILATYAMRKPCAYIVSNRKFQKILSYFKRNFF